ncbi:MAG: hypothetical protein IPN67_20945 [Bacteroidales bacterium]|nr:hypothetical protein [Bacteroidales bacterium]
MYKLLIRWIVFSIAVVFTMLFLFRNRLPFGGGNSSFASEPRNEITRIIFSEQGKELSLEKKGDNWLIDGKSEARKSGILFILRVLQEIKIKSPVSDDLFKSEITGKGIEPVKIRVFENRKLIKSFLVYKTTSNSYGNIMKMKERSKPFIVYVPGYDGNIGSAFTLNELFWQPYTVFNLLPSEIESVKLENLSDTSSSFLITVKNHRFTLSDLNMEIAGWDSTLVTRYLSYFARIPFEKWALEMGEEEKRLVELRQPVYRISVTSTEGKLYVLTLWEKMKEGAGATEKDSDRLLGDGHKAARSFYHALLRY